MSGNSGRRAGIAVLVMVCCAGLLALGQLRGPAASASSIDRAPAAVIRAAPHAAQPYPGGLTVNEFMPDPVSDWNDDGILSDANDEYIEIHNANGFAVDLSGWMLDDVANEGTTPYTLPPGTVIQPFDVRVFFSAQTHVGLNNTGGDSARLLYPDGSVADEHSYTGTQVGDQAYSRTIDGGGTWTTTYPPSPGNPNLPPPPTSTPTVGPTATPFPTGITLNEYMPDPVSDWNDDGILGDFNDEYLEIHNANAFSVDLSGWMLDDAAELETSPYVLPPGSIIQPLDVRVFFSAETGVGLNNSGGDSARLLYPDGTVADEHSYTGTPQPDKSFSRTVDGAGTWVTTYPPSPGRPNQPPPTDTPTATPTHTPTATATRTATAISTATPTGTPTATPTPAPTVDAITLNEFMPDPVTDWNGNGQTGDNDDEYIELYNGHDFAVDLGGWKLDDKFDGGSPPFTLPAGSTIPSHGFLVFFSNQTHIALNNSGGDSVRLLRPDSSEVEVYAYTANAPDEAYSKTSDGGTTWTTTYPPSPGSANLPGPTATPGATGALAGHVFVDADADGVYEPWLGEQGLAGVLVILDDARSYLTNASGWYGFFNIAPGEHTVRHAQPVHMASTTADAYTVTIEPGSTIDELNFGQTSLPPGQIQPPVVLNEFLPSPASDWDGNGVADADDEWVELYNLGDAPVDISGWWLDDEDDSQQRAPDGSAPYMLPVGSTIPAQGFLVVFRSTSGVTLSNSGDDMRLIGPADYEVEAFSFGSTGYDISWSKTVDGGDQWINSYPPSPGTSNQPGSATATATATTTATATATPTPAGTPTPLPGGISLNEYLPDPASDWDGNGVIDAQDEYVEIYNANSFAVDLSGWMLDDLAGGGSRPYSFPPSTTLPGQGFLLVFRSQSGVALNNDGDTVRLLGPDESLIEETSYDSSDDDLAYSKLAEGSSLWTDVYPPSPGQPNLPGPTATPTATATVTPTGSPTATPTATPPPNYGIVRLNEFMPDPASDWNGDGTPTAADEYIELFNPGPDPVDLGGWALDDEDDAAAGALYFYAPEGTQPYIIPAGATIQPGGFLLFFRSETGVALNNDGDWVRLLRPDASLVEAYEYTSSRDDEAYSKTTDGGDLWTRAYPPSPGLSNMTGVTPTPPPTTPTPYPTTVSLNEFMPEPGSDWNGDGASNSDDEYIELYNAAAAPVDLSGWYLDDTDSALAAPDLTAPYQIPSGTTIPARGFLVFFRSDTNVALNNDSADSVRLLWPDSSEVERRDYTTTAPDRAVSKEHEGGTTWTELYPPSPGGPNLPGFTGDEQVRLNELLPSPRDVDWDGDGQANYLDEWIELVNAGDQAANLSGWKLADGESGGPGHTYVLPGGTHLDPGDYLVIFRLASGIALDARDEWVTLTFPDDQLADQFHYTGFSGYDQSWCRLPDGTGDWTAACQESPGAANRPEPGDPGGSGGPNGGGDDLPYDRFNFDLVPIAHARTLPDDVKVTLEGQVTVLPDIFDDQQIYIQDATGGMLVYLRSGEWPPLSEGQWIRVNGWLGTLDGEKEIKLSRIDDIKTLMAAPPPAPVAIRTGDVNEATEGLLAQITGAITGFYGDTTFYLDDGSGEVRITVKQYTGFRRPYVNNGEIWTVVGVVSQNDDEAPYDSNYRILPRTPEDIYEGRPSTSTAASTRTAAADDAVSLAPGDASWNIAPIFLPVTGADNILSGPDTRQVLAVVFTLLLLLAGSAIVRRRAV